MLSWTITVRAGFIRIGTFCRISAKHWSPATSDAFSFFDLGSSHKRIFDRPFWDQAGKLAQILCSHGDILLINCQVSNVRAA
jgi:hypothetical protein